GDGGQKVDVRNEGIRPLRSVVHGRVGVNERNANGLFVEVKVLLALPAMSEAHLAVIGGSDDECVVRQTQVVERVEDLHEVIVRRFHQVAVEVEVIAFLLRGIKHSQALRDEEELQLYGWLGRQTLADCSRDFNVPRQP